MDEDAISADDTAGDCGTDQIQCLLQGRARNAHFRLIEDNNVPKRLERGRGRRFFDNHVRGVGRVGTTLKISHSTVHTILTPF